MRNQLCHRKTDRGAGRRCLPLAAWLALTLVASAEIVELHTPKAPREFYNEGTRKLRDGKLREAETDLQTAVASNDERVQPVALYNLGHVRFQQGAEALKNSADAQATKARGARACAVGDRAIQQADEALDSYDLNDIVNAYLKGRGARKQLKAAAEAVKRAMDSYAAVLSRWQRASGDFKSAHELRLAHEDARRNAEIVDRHIAELVDRIELLKMAAQCCGNKRQELRKRMQEMKKLLPPGNPQQGDSDDDDDDDDDDDQPKQPSPGQEERAEREGREMAITPEEAARLLDSLKLDANRKLPMGMDNTAKPKDRKGREW